VLSNGVANKKIETRKVNRKFHKRIAIYFPSLGKGGVQRVISLLIPMYIEKNYSVVLITEEDRQVSDYVIPDTVKRYVIESIGEVHRKGDYSVRKKQLEKILREENIDVLCHHSAISPLLLNDFLTVNGMNVYFVLCKHQIFSHELTKVKNFYFEQKEIFRLLDGMVVLAQSDAYYWKKLGVKARYIPNPFDEKLNGVKGKANGYIVLVGRLEPGQKKFLDVFPIMQRVVKAFPDCRLRIYGSGDAGTVQYLLRTIEKYDLQDNIFYCGYTLDTNEIYGGARMQLSLAAYEAFPMNIYEGKAYGLPLVTYNMPYLELLSDKKGYISVEQGNVEQAADAIIQIMSDDVLEKRLQEEAKESITRFDEIDIMQEWDELFKELGDSKGSRNCEEEFETVLDTIYGNYERTRSEYQKLAVLYEQLWENYWLQNIKHRIEKDHVDIAIYPYGKEGKRIKRLLNENGIQENFRVDNYAGLNNKEVVSFEDMKKEDLHNILFVVCSSKKEVYYELRKPLYEILDKSNILDIFPEDKVFNKRFF